MRNYALAAYLPTPAFDLRDMSLLHAILRVRNHTPAHPITSGEPVPATKLAAKAPTPVSIDTPPSARSVSFVHPPHMWSLPSRLIIEAGFVYVFRF